MARWAPRGLWLGARRACRPAPPARAAAAAPCAAARRPAAAARAACAARAAPPAPAAVAAARARALAAASARREGVRWWRAAARPDAHPGGAAGGAADWRRPAGPAGPASAGAALLAAAAAAAGATGVVGVAYCEADQELYAEEQRTVELFERCSASVVHINTFAQGIQRRGLRFDLQEIQAGTGSGFVWDERHVVTNFHVIKDADRATVVLADGTSCNATLVGAEPDCDLAVLRLEALDGSLAPLERGSSSVLRVGQRVFAIGNPFGLDQTLTNGIVSGLGREMRGVTGRTMRGLVQTDAAINPGNSGGPLLDARGRLIGVNTMIASPSGAFAGVGFAIPVDTVVRVVQQLVKWGRTKHAYLGVYPAPPHIMQQVAGLMRRQGVPPPEGLLVVGVEPGSPAEEAGLQPMARTWHSLVLGDEVLAINGKVVSDSEQLLDAVEEHDRGDVVEVRYFRRGAAGRPGEVRTARVQLAERPPDRALGARGPAGAPGAQAVAGGPLAAAGARPRL